MLTIRGILEKILLEVGAPGGIIDTLVKEVDELKAKFPEVEELADRITDLLVRTLSPYTSIDNLLNTLRGIGQDIASGLTSVDPEAWKGSV